MAAWLAGLACHFLRLPLVLGYIVAGIALNPFTWGPVLAEGHDVEMLADVGVALLLFTVGLEFPLPKLSQVGRVALFGTPLSVVFTTAIGVILGHLYGWTLQQGIWLGALLSLSSTTVVLRSLSQNGVLNTLSSRVMIGILIMQDLVSVPLMLLLPQMGKSGNSSFTLLRTVVVGLVFVTFWLWSARTWLPKAMARLAAIRSRELFSLTVLASALGIGYTSHMLGLSLAFGAFLAGLVLAESDYSHQALSDMGPLKDLFTLFFFASVGLMIDPKWLLANIGLWGPLVIACWVGKGTILALLVRAFGYSNVVPWACALYLGQMGELAFVIARLGTQSGSLSQPTYKMLITIAAISMMLTPLVAPLTQPLYSAWRRLRPKASTVPLVDNAVKLSNHTIVCGYGRVGRVVASTLRALELPFVITECDENALRRAQQAGYPVVFGEASAAPVLEAASLHEARNVILTFGVPLDLELAVHAIHCLAPQVPVVARASTLEQIEHLSALGVSRVVVAEMEGALEMVHQCLDLLGLSVPETQSLVEQIRRQHYALLAPENDDRALLEQLRRSLRHSRNELIRLPGTAWVGRSLAQLDLRNLTGCTVMAIVRSSGPVLNPGPGEVLLEDDQLLTLGTDEQLEKLRALYPEAPTPEEVSSS